MVVDEIPRTAVHERDVEVLEDDARGDLGGALDPAVRALELEGGDVGVVDANVHGRVLLGGAAHDEVGRAPGVEGVEREGLREGRRDATAPVEEVGGGLLGVGEDLHVGPSSPCRCTVAVVAFAEEIGDVDLVANGLALGQASNPGART